MDRGAGPLAVYFPRDPGRIGFGGGALPLPGMGFAPGLGGAALPGGAFANGLGFLAMYLVPGA